MRGAIRTAVAVALAVSAAPAVAAPTWLAAETAGRPAVPTNASVAAGAPGVAVAAWYEPVAGAEAVQAAIHRPGAGWTPLPSPSQGLAGSACYPLAAVDGTGAVLVVWNHFAAVGCNGARTVRYALLAPGASAWSLSQPVGPADTPSNLDLVLDASHAGPVVIAWSEADATRRRVRAAIGTVAVGLQSPTTVLDVPVADQVYYLSAAAGVGGDAAVQWARVTGSDPLNVETVFRPRGSAFGPPVPMTSYTGTAGGSSANAVAVDGAGNVESLFIESVGTAQRVTSRLRASQIGLWQLPQLVALPTPAFTLSVPAVAFDAQGGAVAVWSEVDFTPPSPYQRRLQAATRLPGLGEPWSAAAPIADPARSDYSFSFAHDVLGTVATAWVGSGTAGPEVRAAVRPPGGPFSPAAVVGLGANRSVAVDAGGNALVGSRGAANEARVAVYDATPPVIAAASAPAALTTGQPGAFAATVVDAWAGLAAGSPTWSFGDGAAAAGSAATHAYGAAGSFPATLNAVDAVGNAASATAGTVAVTDPPVDPASLPSVTLAGARVSARYKQSRLTGAVTATGRTNLPATLVVRVVTTGPRARVLVQLRRAVPAGPYSLRLALPATLVPGRYVVRVQGTSAGVTLPAVQRSFTIRAPAEGVVSRAYAHAVPNGPAALRLRGVRRAVYATFVFASLPRRGPITISWLPPAGARETPGADKPRERRITGGAVVRGAGAHLRPGRWRARLRVHGVLVAETAVRIG